jgi:hypothetical protein
MSSSELSRSDPSLAIEPRLPEGNHFEEEQEDEDDTESFDIDDDLVLLRPPLMVKLASAATMTAGIFAALIGAQTAVIFRMTIVPILIVLTMVSFGGATTVFGWKLRKIRLAGALGGAIMSFTQALLFLIWIVYSFSSGLISPFTWLIPGLSIAAGALCVLVHGTCQKSEDARVRLHKNGIEF